MSSSEIVEEKIEYNDGNSLLEGLLCKPPGTDEQHKKPAVLVFHAFGGRTDFENGRAKELAKLGYVGFAADVYGKGVRGKNMEENFALMAKYMDDRNGLLLGRLKSALETVKKMNFVDETKVAAIGYCFGGLCVLDMARNNLGIRAAVSFHGNPKPPPPSGNTKKIDAAVLYLHGDADIHIPMEQVRTFMEEMRGRDATWEVVIYAGAKHAFTIPGSDSYNAEGVGYNERVDRRSWASMKDLFATVLA